MELFDPTDERAMVNQQHIGRQLRMKVIDWLLEVIQKFKITDRSILFQTMELLDRYYQHYPNMPVYDLQLTAVTCFFIAAKNILIEPITLQNAIEHMCYNKFTEQQFLNKEHEIRGSTDYKNESANYLDFLALFMKIIRSEFCSEIAKQKGY